MRVQPQLMQPRADVVALSVGCADLVQTAVWCPETASASSGNGRGSRNTPNVPGRVTAAAPAQHHHCQVLQTLTIISRPHRCMSSHCVVSPAGPL